MTSNLIVVQNFLTRKPVRSKDSVNSFRDVFENLSNTYKNQARYLMDLLDNVSDAVISTDLRFNIKSWNKGAEHLYGYSKEEVLGKPFETIVPTIYLQSDRDKFLSEIHKNSFWKGEVIQKTKLNKSLTILASVSAVKDLTGEKIGLVSVNRDISESKKNEALMRQMAAIVESSDDAIFGKTLDGIITNWNPGAERLYGYSAKEAIGKHLKLIIPIDKREEYKEIMEVIKMGESVDHLETVRHHKDGRIIDVSLTVSPIKDGQGSIIGASTIAQDITQSKELERRKDAFIGMASHELKTPITTLKAFTQVLLQQITTEKDPLSNRFLVKMHEQLDKLASLVSELLDLSKIQVGKLELTKERFDFDMLLHEVVENIQEITPSHKIIINGELKKKIYGDKDRIAQVVMNLLSNAIKYSPLAKEVIVTVKTNNNKLAVSVQDYGIGISKKHLEKIFDRFYRAAGANEKTFTGLGIGLYIASEVVKRHGGKIWAESIKRKGSTFYFAIPLK